MSETEVTAAPYNVATIGGNGMALRVEQARECYLGLLVLVVLRSWIMPLGSSLWLDETATFWIVKNGPLELVSRWARWGGAQSLLHSWIAWAGITLGGHGEVALRSPSLLAMALSTLLLYRLASRVLSRDAAWPTILVFLSVEEVAFAAVDARPYAFALLTLIASTFLLVRWMDTGRAAFALGYAGLAPLTIYFHPLFAIAFVSHAVYVLYCLYTGARVRLGSIALAVLLAGSLLTPYAVLFLWLMHGPHNLSASTTPHSAALHALSASATPSLAALFERLLPPVLICGFVLGALLVLVFVRELRLVFGFQNQHAAVLILSWWLLPILLFFAISVLTPAKVFIGRYLLPAAPGLALLAGWAISAFELYNARVLIVSMVTVIALISNTGKQVWPLHGGEDWRGAMAAVRSVAHDTQVPVIVTSGYIESAFPANYAQLTPTGHLLSPLSIYPAEGRIIPIPLRVDENWLIEQIAAHRIERCDRFLLVTKGQRDLENWFRGHFHPLGFLITGLGQPPGVDVLLFEKR